MKSTRILVAAAMAVCVSHAAIVHAQTFPTKAVRIVVPQAPGGASDALARIIGQRLSDRWHQPVVVENRAGAGGLIGTDVVAKSAPDGYTLLLAYDGTHAVNASLYKSLPFDPLKDFSAVATLANVPFVLAVNASSPTKDVKEFIERAKANPGKLNYGSAGNGSVNHLLGAMFSKAAGVELVHVPYKGGPGDFRSARRQRRVRAHQYPIRGRPYTIRARARTRSDQRQAVGSTAKRPDHRGGRHSRLRCGALVRIARAGWDAAADCQADQ